MKVLFKFIIHKYSSNIQQLFFNDSLQYMLEILDDFRVYLYKRKDLEGDNVEWVLVKIITRYAKQMSVLSVAPYLFSPSFMRYLDFDMATNNYIILDSITG